MLETYAPVGLLLGLVAFLSWLNPKPRFDVVFSDDSTDELEDSLFDFRQLDDDNQEAYCSR